MNNNLHLTMYGTATGNNYFNSYSSLEPDQAMRINGDGRTLSGLDWSFQFHFLNILTFNPLTELSTGIFRMLSLAVFRICHWWEGFLLSWTELEWTSHPINRALIDHHSITKTDQSRVWASFSNKNFWFFKCA